MSNQSTDAGLISSQDLPKLAEAGHVAAPMVGNSAAELREAVQAALAEQWSLMGIIDTGKKAADLGKKAADALTDKGKEIEDKAIHREKDARDEAHRKMNEDKAKKHGREAGAHGATTNAFARALSELRG
ncbi:hypothetical protein HUW62_39835 [Myxococcus sp. AM011]|uniref:hypothetical protein n=1 Tax=Myxococcus sp. AM011 TaxID=2745200 RepID=UPI001595359B|nr:hypothetical protein [Myxococcus sp. AM011]NVJ27383.1 hypothetical protein [Myxococcus sp. AM011]